MTTRIETLETRLRDALEPCDLDITDDSHLHAGHEGAKDGRGHFTVKISSPAFKGKTRIQRHQMVYAAVGDLMETDIHALSITAQAPSDSLSN